MSKKSNRPHATRRAAGTTTAVQRGAQLIDAAATLAARQVVAEQAKTVEIDLIDYSDESELFLNGRKVELFSDSLHTASNMVTDVINAVIVELPNVTFTRHNLQRLTR